MFSVRLKNDISHPCFCIQMMIDSLKKTVLFLLHGAFPNYFYLKGCIHPDCRKN